MLSILLIEDDPDKRDAISAAIGEAVGDADVRIAETAAAARDSLSTTRFDIAILDIALPKYPQAEINPSAGLDLLEDLVRRPHQYLIPAHIVGLTGFPEVLDAVQGRFASHLLTLSLYQVGTASWRDALQARLRHVANAALAVEREEGTNASDLAVVCALPLELEAVLALPWNWRQVAQQFDHTIYWQGQYESGGFQRTAYAGLAARMGMPAAAAVASKMIHSFRPTNIAITGIAAGIRGRVSLGDVIAADPCWDWGSGKWIQSGAQSNFSAAPYQIGLDPWVRERIRLTAADPTWLMDALVAWPGEMLVSQVQLHLGPLASGAAVLADGTTAKRIVDQNRQLLGIEMEAYGVFAAAEEARVPRPRALAFKTVVDFADDRKDDRYQRLGAYLAAASLKRLAESHL